MNNIYPLDIWHIIFHHCDLLSQSELIIVCSDFYNSFFITDLYNISNIYQNKLTMLVLQQRKFNKLIRLDIRSNQHINNISFLTTLKKLRVGYSCRITQQGIQGLNLIDFDAGHNEQIKNISFMSCRN